MKIAIVLLAAALLVIGVVYGRAADRTDRTPVPSFDLARYMGTWYEIARYDHPFERGLAGVQARYELEARRSHRGVQQRDGLPFGPL